MLNRTRLPEFDSDLPFLATHKVKWFAIKLTESRMHEYSLAQGHIDSSCICCAPAVIFPASSLPNAESVAIGQPSAA